MTWSRPMPSASSCSLCVPSSTVVWVAKMIFLAAGSSCNCAAICCTPSSTIPATGVEEVCANRVSGASTDSVLQATRIRSG